MLTQDDIVKIIKAQKEVFPSKEEFEGFKEGMRKDFSDLLTSVDSYAQKADTYFKEMVMLSHKVDRHEKWLQKIAEKIDIKLKY